MVNTEVQNIFLQEYGSAVNFITPIIVEYGEVGPGSSLFYEVSHGSGIFSKHIVGVTILEVTCQEGIVRRDDLSTSFQGDNLYALIQEGIGYALGLADRE